MSEPGEDGRIEPMSDRWMTAEELAQARGEAKLAPHLPAMLDTIATIVTACNTNPSELVLMLPESEWSDVPAEERAVMVLGCQVIHADVPAPMVAVRARRTFGFEPVTANPPGSSVPWTPPGEEEAAARRAMFCETLAMWGGTTP